MMDQRPDTREEVQLRQADGGDGSLRGTDVKDKQMRTLRGAATRWRAAMRNAATGPLVVAAEVVDVINDWDRYKKEAGGLSAASWLRKTFGSTKKGPAYWRRRARAVSLLGESSRRMFHHEVAVWVINKTPADKLDEVKFILLEATRKNNGIPLSKMQAERLLKDCLGITRQPRVVTSCERCEVMAQLLREHGIEPPA